MNVTSSDYYPRRDAGFLHLLSCGDPTMALLVEAKGPLSVEERRRGRPDDAYGALVRSIVGQQLSTVAARTIYGRLIAFFDHRPPTPAELLAADEETLGACGLSRPKISYLCDLARHVLEGTLDLPRLRELPDDEVASRLAAVKGIGQWTADMFLIFHLGRADVLPVGDLGIRRAVERSYCLRAMPRPQELHAIAKPWRPHRTLACLYLWESLDTNILSKGRSDD
jgi:DNA-3-methyladenine glycosylase II